jgi:hypothetical protein
MAEQPEVVVRAIREVLESLGPVDGEEVGS